jgi:3'(2'), 5'-bisphosphate nucleotidase
MIKENFIKFLPDLISICEQAAELQIKYHKTKINISIKYDGTPVTEVDIASSKIITTGLKSITPDIRVISEEYYSGVDASGYFWLVDPLDGTKNYINNGDQFCINIALIKDNFPILGLIYSPVTKDLYYAFKNFGSYYKKFNDEAVEIKTSKLTIEGIKNIYTSASIKPKIIKNLTESLNNAEIIKYASALKFGLIASGGGCFYPRIGPTHEWDTASGQCIIEEAGGIVIDKFMKRLQYNKNSKYLNKEFFVIGDPSFGWERIINMII